MKKIISCATVFLAAAVFLTGCNVVSEGADDKNNDGSSINFSHGTVIGSKYESSFLGIGIELEEGWRFANDKELAESNGLDEITDKSLEEALKTKNFICDMIAERKFEGGADSITLTFPNTEAAGTGGMTEREYAEATLVGIENATAVTEAVNIGNEEHSSIKLIGKTGGRDYCQRMIFVSRNGYIGMITLTCISEEDINEIISRFYIL